MHSTTIKRTIATALTGAAIAGAVGTPAASAMPATDVGQGRPGDVEVVALPQRSSAPAPDEAPGAGFDLSSAAIGAAAGGGLLAVILAAGGMAGTRSMTRRHRVAGA